MRNIKLTIEYDGTHFCGWQIQEKDKRTVQGELKKALHQIFKQRISIIGSGRTDSGAHAIGQVANFKTESKLTLKEIVKALNCNLPDDIVILKAQEAKLNFHAQYNVKSKLYRYTLLNRSVRSTQQRNFCYFYPYPINVGLMRQEAKSLIGRKDFKSFQASDSSNKKQKQNTIRTIKRIKIVRENPFVYIDIEANGFLYKMVRNIVGTLLAIGSDRLPKGSMRRILEQKSRRAAAKTAPSKGLCLVKVKY